MEITKQEAVDKILDRLFEQYDISNEDMDDFVRWTIDDVIEDSRLTIDTSMEYKAVSGFNKLILDGALERDEYSSNVNAILADFAKSVGYSYRYRREINNIADYMEIVEQEIIDHGYLNGISVEELAEAVEKYAVEVLGMDEGSNIKFFCEFYRNATKEAFIGLP